MQFCPRCAGAIEERVPEGDDRARYVCAACTTVHYINPKVVVGAVCSWDDRVLLCRRAIEPRRGYWTIPAGYLECGESTEAGTRREAWEEARARIDLDGVLAIYNVTRISQVQVLYRAQLLDAAVAAGEESLEVMLCPWTAIPWDELAFPTVTWVLQRAESLRQASGPLVPVGNPEPA